MKKVFVIAEAGVNHNGDFTLAKELKDMVVARRSLVALNEINNGEIFTSDNLGIKRPGSGLSPMLYWKYLGKKSQNTYMAEELIKNEE